MAEAAGSPPRPLAVPERAAAPRRELVLAAVTVVALARLVDGAAAWAVAVLLVGAIVLGTRRVLGEADPSAEAPGVPAAAMLAPAVAGLACLGAIRLVPLGLALVSALAAAAILLDRTIRTEAELIAARRGPTREDRARVLVQSLLVGFLAFVGAAALVPGGLPEPAAAGGGARLSLEGLALLAGADALVAGLLGYRASTLRVASRPAAAWSAATYAGVIAIAAGAVRAAEIPRLAGPALLTLVFFLWDAFHGTPPARRLDPRWIWQTLLLVALGAVVAAWNAGIR